MLVSLINRSIEVLLKFQNNDISFLAFALTKTELDVCVCRDKHVKIMLKKHKNCRSRHLKRRRC